MLDGVVEGLPEPEQTFDWLPTLKTIAQFSHLTMNGQKTHLNKKFALSEGYPGAYLSYIVASPTTC